MWWLRDRDIGQSGLISADFSNESGLRERRRASRIAGARINALDDAQRAHSLANEILAVGRERYDRVASEVAIEARDPFMDIRVIEFCLSLPWRQLEYDGWPKILLRRAMAGKLSQFVRWRTGREHLGFAHLRVLIGGFGPSDVPGPKIRETLAPYVRPEKLPDWPLTPRDEEDCKEWVDALCLYYWLKRVGCTLCS